MIDLIDLIHRGMDGKYDYIYNIYTVIILL